MSTRAPGAVSRDAFLGGRLLIRQPVTGYRAAIDPVLLAAFVAASPGQRVLELGCGVGVAVLCLGARVAELDLHGLEIQEEYAGLARMNAVENGIALTVHEGDIRRPPEPVRQAGFHHVILNPPFYPAGAAMPSRDPGRDRAHREEADLGEWIAAAARRLVPGGWLTMIHRAERLADMLAALRGPMGQITVLPVAPRAGRPAARVLIRARKGSAGPLTLTGPLVLHGGAAHATDSGRYSPIVEEILRGGADLRPENVTNPTPD